MMFPLPVFLLWDVQIMILPLIHWMTNLEFSDIFYAESPVPRNNMSLQYYNKLGKKKHRFLASQRAVVGVLNQDWD